MTKKLAKTDALADAEKTELTTSISEAVGVDIPQRDAQEWLEASMEAMLSLIPACIPEPEATWLHATLNSAVRWANGKMWNRLPQVEALLTVTKNIEVVKDRSTDLADVPLMVGKDATCERLSAVVRSVQTRKHIASDGCFLGDKKLAKAYEKYLCEHCKMGVASAQKEAPPVAGGMSVGSTRTSKTVEQDWEGICDIAQDLDEERGQAEKETQRGLPGGMRITCSNSVLESAQGKLWSLGALWANVFAFRGKRVL